MTGPVTTDRRTTSLSAPSMFSVSLTPSTRRNLARSRGRRPRLGPQTSRLTIATAENARARRGLRNSRLPSASNQTRGFRSEARKAMQIVPLNLFGGRSPATRIGTSSGRGISGLVFASSLDPRAFLIGAARPAVTLFTTGALPRGRIHAAASQPHFEFDAAAQVNAGAGAAYRAEAPSS